MNVYANGLNSKVTERRSLRAVADDLCIFLSVACRRNVLASINLKSTIRICQWRHRLIILVTVPPDFPWWNRTSFPGVIPAINASFLSGADVYSPVLCTSILLVVCVCVCVCVWVCVRACVRACVRVCSSSSSSSSSVQFHNYCRIHFHTRMHPPPPTPTPHPNRPPHN